MKKTFLFLLAGLGLLIAGCSTAPKKAEGKATLHAAVEEAVAAFKARDPSIGTFFQDSEGYVVLPTVGKGAFIIGGAYGHGEVYQKGRLVGYCNMTQATVGASLGGQSFSEIIFFQSHADLAVFQEGEFTFSAQATAVALDAGAAAKADYRNGMAVFAMANKGLMVDASVGGQKFKYQAK